MSLDARIKRLSGESASDDRAKRLAMTMSSIDAMRKPSSYIEPYAKVAFERYCGDQAYQNFCEDAALFEAKYPDWKVCFENILANHFLVVNFPNVGLRLNAKDAGIVLKNVYAIMRVLSIAYTKDKDGIASLADVLACVFWMTEHTPDFYYIFRVQSIFRRMIEDRQNAVRDMLARASIR